MRYLARKSVTVAAAIVLTTLTACGGSGGSGGSSSSDDNNDNNPGNESTDSDQDVRPAAAEALGRNFNTTIAGFPGLNDEK